ncbi:MAG: hypothetical protein AB7I08_08650 [Thermoleophilia bacterium]
MSRSRSYQGALCASFAALMVVAVVAGPATASRAPTNAERSSLRAAVLGQCNAEDPPCTWKRAVVSTKNARFALAYANSSLTDYNVIYRRASTGTTRWRSRIVLSGGVVSCSRLLRAAPRAVLRDLKVTGLKSNSVGYCGY